MKTHPSEILKNCSVVLLAAGASSRMGTPKGLLDYNGKPWLSSQLKRLRLIGFTQCVLVLGSAIERYQKEIPELNGSAIKTDFQIFQVHNPDWQKGPFSSVLAGLKHASLANQKGCFVHLLDVPICEQQTWVDLVTAMEVKPEALAATPIFNGHGGHPVYLKQEFCQQLVTIPLDAPDARLDLQLKHLGEHHIRIPVESSCILDNFNTPDEWEIIKTQLTQQNASHAPSKNA